MVLSNLHVMRFRLRRKGLGPEKKRSAPMDALRLKVREHLK